ncbi:hypothetical protein ES705_47436 [subsurface metagenome]
MAEHINTPITALSILAAVILTYFLIYFPSKRKQERKQEKEEKSDLLLQIRSFMDSVLKY